MQASDKNSPFAFKQMYSRRASKDSVFGDQVELVEGRMLKGQILSGYPKSTRGIQRVSEHRLSDIAVWRSQDCSSHATQAVSADLRSWSKWMRKISGKRWAADDRKCHGSDSEATNA